MERVKQNIKKEELLEYIKQKELKEKK